MSRDRQAASADQVAMSIRQLARGLGVSDTAVRKWLDDPRWRASGFSVRPPWIIEQVRHWRAGTLASGEYADTGLVLQQGAGRRAQGAGEVGREAVDADLSTDPELYSIERQLEQLRRSGADPRALLLFQSHATAELARKRRIENDEAAGRLMPRAEHQAELAALAHVLQEFVRRLPDILAEDLRARGLDYEEIRLALIAAVAEAQRGLIERDQRAALGPAAEDGDLIDALLAQVWPERTPAERWELVELAVEARRLRAGN